MSLEVMAQLGLFPRSMFFGVPGHVKKLESLIVSGGQVLTDFITFLSAQWLVAC